MYVSYSEKDMAEVGRSTADGKKRGSEEMKESEVSHQSMLYPHLMDLFSSLGDRLQQSHVLDARALLSERQSKVQNFYFLLRVGEESKTLSVSPCSLFDQ